jgi:hypothetical protein
MGITLKDKIELAKELAEEFLEATCEKLREFKDKAKAEKNKFCDLSEILFDQHSAQRIA